MLSEIKMLTFRLLKVMFNFLESYRVQAHKGTCIARVGPVLWTSGRLVNTGLSILNLVV